jgi:hypothetical protein
MGKNKPCNYLRDRSRYMMCKSSEEKLLEMFWNRKEAVEPGVSQGRGRYS